MKSKLAIIAISMMLMVIALPADNNMNLSAAPGYWCKHPVIHQLPNGKIICLWGEGAGEGTAEVIYRILDPATGVWTAKTPSVGRRYSAMYPQICEDRDGVLHMAYMDGTARFNRDIWYTNYDYRKPLGQQWAPREIVAKTPEQSGWQRISVDEETGDIYVSWQHVYEYSGNPDWHSNVVVYRKAKDPVTGLYGEWDGDVKLSRNISEVDIHQATVFSNGKLHGVFEEGGEGAWKLQYNWLPGGDNYQQGAVDTISDMPGASIPAYWPELEADSKGNLYCVWSERSNETKAAFKPLDQPWQYLGTMIQGSQITMIGLKVARNDVAYVLHSQGYSNSEGSGERPVFVRFTNTNVSPVTVVRDTGRGQRVLEIEVDQEGNAHCVWAGPRTAEFYNIYYERVPQVGGPKVSINVPAVVLTNEDVEIQGEVISSATPILKHRFFCREEWTWGGEDDSPNFTMNFSKEGLYTIHYYVADSNNLMGHASVTVEAIDAPFQPTNATRSTDIVRGLLFRAWINSIAWKSDGRNEGKFANLSHFNIYKRSVGSADWGTPVADVAYVDEATTYEFKDQSAFMSQAQAQSFEYAVTLVAVVNGQEKESRKTIL